MEIQALRFAEPTHVTASNDSLPLADDTYLYGETNQVNQIGQGYMVFRKQGQAVTGAFYYPQSELSCFTGKIENHRLSVLSLGFPHENAIAVEISLTKCIASQQWVTMSWTVSVCASEKWRHIKNSNKLLPL